MSYNSTPVSLMQTEPMRTATERAQRTLSRETGIHPEHSRDLACELGLTFALAAISATTTPSGVS